MNNYCIALLALLLFIILYGVFYNKNAVNEGFHNYNILKKKKRCKKKKPKCKKKEEDCEVPCKEDLVCPPCKKCPPACPERCPDLSRYVLKTSIPPCPKCPDMSEYIRKSEIPPPLKCPNMDKFVLKSSIPPCAQCQECPPCKCGDCPECPEIKQNLTKLLKENCPKFNKQSGIQGNKVAVNYSSNYNVPNNNNYKSSYYTQNFNKVKGECSSAPFSNIGINSYPDSYSKK